MNSRLFFALAASAAVPSVATAQTELWFTDGGAASDRFGLVVSKVGDLNGDLFPDVIVGAPNSDIGGSDSGAAYLLSGVDGTLIQAFPGAVAGDSLGFSVAGAGDVDADGTPDFILGSRFSDAAGPDFGRATVISGATGLELHAFNGTDSNSRFGAAVGAAGDVNNDGYADLIVGARLNEVASQVLGRASVFSGFDGSLLYEIDGGNASDQFGRAVGSAGDVNGDGHDDFIVGAPGDDDGGSSSGSATVFSGFDGSILHKFDGAMPNDAMGVKVAGAGDVDGDGADDVIVGIPGSDIGGADRGAAQVFSGATGALLHTFTGQTLGAEFGSAVDGAGDVNGDGYMDLIAGARLENTAFVDTGAAYVYSGFDGSLLHAFSGSATGNEFGDSAIGMGDVNGDGFSDLLIGAFGTDIMGVNSGRVRAFSGRDTIGSSICDAVPNTTGLPARLVAEGSTTATENNLTLSVMQLPVGVNGYFLTSPDEFLIVGAGGSAGNLCIASTSIGRYAGDILTADGSGSASLTIDLMMVPLPMGFTASMAGDTRYWQFWYRNASSSNFSDAVGVTFD